MSNNVKCVVIQQRRIKRIRIRRIINGGVDRHRQATVDRALLPGRRRRRRIPLGQAAVAAVAVAAVHHGRVVAVAEVAVAEAAVKITK